jgi:succinate dehydrogenase / fumarate reductase flavoprotein subunit
MKQVHQTIVCNVLVIGSGGAGHRAAIAARKAGKEVIMLGKRLRRDAHTVLAAGGINAALANRDPEDSWQQHFSDTIQEGYFLSDPTTVEILTREAPTAIQELANWGCPFARTKDGKIDQRFFGAHKYRRTCYAGDYTGRAVLQTLADQAETLDIPMHEHKYVSSLLVKDGVCFGAMAFDLRSGDRTVYQADAVVLAAGGHTRIFRKSSSRRDENKGEGIFLALKAGCELADMEMVQFHPTGMVSPEEWAGTLVTEAVRGEGGRLLNKDSERFMERYDAKRMELSTRDIVALANYTEIMEGRGGPNEGVFLDISHKDRDFILEKIPRMYRQFLDSQLLDITQQPMEVSPTAHYSMGGVVVDPETHATQVEGLFAAGEVSSGLHGGNRLGGNSLIETVVFGRRAGAAAAQHSDDLEYQIRNKKCMHAAHDELDATIGKGDYMARPMQREIRNVLWNHCGVVRDEDKLQQGLQKILEMKDVVSEIDVRPSSQGYQDLALALDFNASVYTAECTLLSALARKESRGAHHRSDFQDTDPAQTVNFKTYLSEGKIRLTQQKVEQVSEDLLSYFDEEELSMQGRLLE